ncbi:MAG: hypothetical protein P9M14_09510 [Candidatus Alcyoniella australis]|nr:hypothetical protein [Candidatus Alcyoniella australis]
MNVCPQCKRLTAESQICSQCGSALISDEQWRQRLAQQGAALKAERIEDEQIPAQSATAAPQPAFAPTGPQGYAPPGYTTPYPQAIYTPMPMAPPQPAKPKQPLPPYFALKLLLGSALSVALFAGALIVASFI